MALKEAGQDLDLHQLAVFCEVSYKDLWKSLKAFWEAFGAELPLFMKSRISELETTILLQGIWSTDEI